MELSLTSELLQCAICMGDLENAHALPCLHSFCALCLQNHISTSQKKVSKSLRLKRFPCPTCRVWINSPGSGLCDFPRDFRVVRLKDAIKEWKDKVKRKDDHTCGMCDEDFKDPVDNFCTDCQKYLCALCLAEHKTTSVLSNHVVFSESTMLTEKEKSLCTMHSKEPISYHCETCNMGICVKCIMGEHKDHDVMDTDYSCNLKRVELRNCMSQLRNQLSLLNEVMFDLANTEGHVKSQQEQTKLQIRKHSHKVINYVYHEQSRLLNEADKDYQVKYDFLSQRRETCRMYINQFTKLQSRLESLLRVQDINTISENFKSIVKDVQDIKIMEKYSKQLVEIPKCAQFVSNGVAQIGQILPGERTTTMDCSDLHKKYSHLNQDKSTEHLYNEMRMKNDVKKLTTVSNGKVSPLQCKTGAKQCLPMATLLCQIGGNGSKDSLLGLPYGISFTSDGKLIVGENGHERTQVFSRDGKSLKVIPLPGCCPRSLCSISDQVIVFTDENEKCLKKVNLETSVVSSITARYSENTVSFPFGVAALSDERFVISDMIYETVSITSSAGIKEKQLGEDDDRDAYDNPSYLATDSENNIFIADSGHHKIKVYDKHGRFLFHFGDDGIKAGQLRYPKGIAVEKNGLIFVADAGNDRVVVFSRLGFFLTVLADRNSGIERPTGLAYSPSGLLAVSMPDRHEVFVFQIEDSTSGQF